MKKSLVVVVGGVIVLAAALAGLPFWFGMQAENAYQTMIDNTTQSGDLTVTHNSFQRGWLDSTADTTFTITGTPITFSVLHRIHHGPFPLDDDFQIQPVLGRVKSQMSVGLPAGFAKLPPITGQTTIYLAGNSRTQVSMVASKTAMPEGGGIEWKGLTGAFETSADFKSTKGEFTAPQLQVSGKDGKNLNLSRLKINLDQTRSPSGFDLGTVGLAVDKLLVDDGTTGKTEISALAISTQTQEAGGQLNSTLSFQFREALSGEDKQGPGQINVQIRKLDVATLVKFRKDVREVRNQKIPAEQANMMVLGKTLEVLGQLAKTSPELEITKLSFKTADGEIAGKAKFVLDGSQLDVSGNPMLMLKALSGEGEIQMPDSIVRLLATSAVKSDIEALKTSGKLKQDEVAKLTPKRIEMITQRAIRELPQYKDSVINRLHLVPDGANYKIVAIFKDGKLLVNNAPVQLP